MSVCWLEVVVVVLILYILIHFVVDEICILWDRNRVKYATTWLDIDQEQEGIYIESWLITRHSLSSHSHQETGPALVVSFNCGILHIHLLTVVLAISTNSSKISNVIQYTYHVYSYHLYSVHYIATKYLQCRYKWHQ